MNGRLISRGGNAHSRGAGGSNPQQPLLLQRSTTFKFTVNPAAVQQQQQGNSTLLSHLGQQPDIADQVKQVAEHQATADKALEAANAELTLAQGGLREAQGRCADVRSDVEHKRQELEAARHGGCLQRSLDALYARAYARQAINQKLRVELDATRKAKAAQREAWQEKVMEFVKQAEATRVQMAHLRKQYSG